MSVSGLSGGSLSLIDAEVLIQAPDQYVDPTGYDADTEHGESDEELELPGSSDFLSIGEGVLQFISEEEAPFLEPDFTGGFHYSSDSSGESVPSATSDYGNINNFLMETDIQDSTSSDFSDPSIASHCQSNSRDVDPFAGLTPSQRRQLADFI